MRVGIIGRTEILYDTALRLRTAGHQVAFILTTREAPEYTRTAADFRDLAAQWNVAFAQGSRLAEHAALLRDAAADIAVSMNFTAIIPQAVIDWFPLGILNIHGGDLPRYRGNACQAWAILNGEARIGLCVHRMIGGELDSGDIVARDYLPIDLRTKVTAVWEWMRRQAPTLVVEALERLGADPRYVLQRQPSEPGLALRCYPRRPEDGRIDWRRPAEDVLRLVNASNRPYAGAFCVFEDQRMTVWDAELVDDGEVFCAVPGQVTAIGADHVEVACGRGKLRLLSVQVDGGTEVAPARHITSLRRRLG